MRVTCPNCAAAYEVPEPMLSAGGRHVQCSVCHTRWFAAAPAGARPMSEEQILQRLESWSARPRPVVVAARDAPEAPEAPPMLDAEAEFRWEGPAPMPEEAREPEAVAAAEPSLAAAAEPKAVAAAERSPAKPEAAGTRAEGNAFERGEPEAGPPGLRARSRRLEIAPGPGGAAPAAIPPKAARGRFGSGLALAIGLAALAAVVYLLADDLAARLPAVAPAVESYRDLVDGARAWIEAMLLPEARAG